MTRDDLSSRRLPFTVRWHAPPGGWHWGEVTEVVRSSNNNRIAIIRDEGTVVRKMLKSIVPSERGEHP